MATLDDAAEALVVKLQGLDSEIEDSQHRLADLGARLEATGHEVEQEWIALTEAVAALLRKIQEEQQQLDHEVQQAHHATTDTQQAVSTSGAEANSEIAESGEHLEALAQHANALHATLESLATEAGETPAHDLTQRVGQIEEELAHALDEARDFVQNDVVHGIEELGHDIRDRCQALRTSLAEGHTQALKAAFDEWETKVEGLEQYVRTQGFQASHQHVHDVVEYALTECQTAFTQQLEQIHQMVEALVGQVREVSAEVQGARDTVVVHTGNGLETGLDGTRDSVANALSSLGSVRDLLAGYSFIQV